MTTIGLIRHGITEWNCLNKAQGHSDIPLNETGRKQATVLGSRLAEEEAWDLIISSDLSRAAETAQIIGRAIQVPVQLDSRLRENDCGAIAGTTEEERLEKWGTAWRELDLGMESFEAVGKRGAEFLEEAARLYTGKRVLVVSHGAWIGLTLQRLLPEEFPDTHMENTSVTILEHADEKWGCALYNCTKHLPH